MAQPLRIEGAGFWYHVMCRGNGGRRVATRNWRDKHLKRMIARLT